MIEPPLEPAALGEACLALYVELSQIRNVGGVHGGGGQCTAAAGRRAGLPIRVGHEFSPGQEGLATLLGRVLLPGAMLVP